MYIFSLNNLQSIPLVSSHRDERNDKQNTQERNFPISKNSAANICWHQAVSMGLWEMGGMLFVNILKHRMYIMPKTPAAGLDLSLGCVTADNKGQYYSILSPKANLGLIKRILILSFSPLDALFTNTTKSLTLAIPSPFAPTSSMTTSYSWFIFTASGTNCFPMTYISALCFREASGE